MENTNPSQQVSTPAILLMVVGVLTVLFALLGFVQVLTGTGNLTPDQIELFEQQGMGAFVKYAQAMRTAGPITNLLSLGLGALLFMGGLKMKNLESYGLAMAAAIVAVIPCFNGCCCIGIPAGIWALVVLNKPEVKAAFR